MSSVRKWLQRTLYPEKWGRASRRRKQGRSIADAEQLDRRVLPAAGIGLQAQYFPVDDLTGTAVTQVDPTVSFDGGHAAPASGISQDSFSVRWSGQIEAQFTESHTFLVNAAGGARLWINGQLMVDQFEVDSVAEATGSIDLLAGRRYDVQLEYRDENGASAVSLEWQSPSRQRSVVPASQMFPAARGSITLEHFEQVSVHSMEELHATPLEPGSSSAEERLTHFEFVANSADSIARRVSGTLHAPETGLYRFYLAADDQAELWMTLGRPEDPHADKQKIAEVTSAVSPRNWTAAAEQQSAPIHLVAGQSYFISALHTDPEGPEHLSVAWLRPGRTEAEVIPGQYLAPVRPVVQIYAGITAVAEDSTEQATFHVVRTGGSLASPLTVHYSVTGDAENGVDFAELPGSITIPAGERSAEISVLPIADQIAEADESFVLELQADSAYDVGLKSQRTAHGSIRNSAAAPAGATPVFQNTELNDFTFFGGNFSTLSDPDEGDVLQAEIATLPEDSYSAQLFQTIDEPVSEGDILFAEFRVRSVNGPGEITAVFEEAGGQYTKSLSQGVPVRTTWEIVQLPFTATENYAAGEARLGFHMGHQIQTLQFADIRVLNYGPPQSLSASNTFLLYEHEGDWGDIQTVPITNEAFRTARQVRTDTIPPESWHIQAWLRNSVAVEDGHVMRLEFHARAAAGISAQSEVMVQRTDSFTQLHSESLSLTPEWTAYSRDIVSSDHFGPDDLQVAFNLGFGPQTVEIADFSWRNISHKLDVEDLPRNMPAASWDGRSGVDPWRDNAVSEIESHRTGSLRVRVYDVNGSPIDGAVVSVRQQSHDFLFGSAIDAFDGRLAPDGTDEALKYQSEIRRLFNTVAVENSLKWPRLLQDRQRGITAAQFAADNDLRLRGHNVIWPSREYMPTAVWDEYDARVVSEGQAAAGLWLQNEILTRIDDVSTTFAGLVHEWDVVNEPYSNRDVMDILDDSIVTSWFQAMRDANPDVALALNDYDIFASNGTNAAHRSDFKQWLTTLSAAGLLDVIGEQSHYNDGNLTDIARLGELIGEYDAQFGVPIAITEFDVNSRDEQLQADYLRDYLTMSFSQPAVSQFLHWGFWEGAHYLPEAALYRTDFSPKPGGQVYEDLVFGSWWTDERATTFSGDVELQAFHGSHTVVVEYAGQRYESATIVRDSEFNELRVDLPVVAANYEPPRLFIPGPQIQSPAGPMNDQTPVFQWSPVPNALSFDVWLEVPGANNNPVISTNVNGTSFTPPSELGISRYRLWLKANLSNGQPTEWSTSDFQISLPVILHDLPFHADNPTPTITWDPVPGAAAYRVFVSNATAGGTVVADEIVTDTVFAPAESLEFGKHRIWARAIAPDNFRAEWSPAEEYYVGPDLLSPSTSMFNRRPEFTWTTLPGIAGFQLYVARGNTIAINEPFVAGTSFIPADNLEIGDYRWWIRPFHTSGRGGEWSAAGEFSAGGTPRITEVVTNDANGLTTVNWQSVEGAGSFEVYLYNDDGLGLVSRETGIVGNRHTFPPLIDGSWRVWIKSWLPNGDSGRWSRSHSFEVRSAAADLTTVPTGPGGPTFDTTPEFSWSADSEAVEFELFLTDGGTETHQPGLAGTTWTPAAPLAATTWSWWLRGRNAAGDFGPWSTASTFDTSGRAVLLSPLSSTSNAMPTVTWTTVAGALRYEFQLDNLTTGDSSYIRDNHVTVAEYALTSPLAPGLYRAWVRAVSSFTGAVGPWSLKLDFEVLG